MKRRFAMLIMVGLLYSCAYKVIQRDMREWRKSPVNDFVQESRELIPGDAEVCFDGESCCFRISGTRWGKGIRYSDETDYGHPFYFYAWRQPIIPKDMYGNKCERYNIYSRVGNKPLWNMMSNCSFYLFNFEGKIYQQPRFSSLFRECEDSFAFTTLAKSGKFSLMKITVLKIEND
jgi:hypothetical protein